MPTVAQPFLLTEYYRMCRRERRQLPVMFQRELVWEPKGAEWEAVRELLEGKGKLLDESGEEKRDSHQEDGRMEGLEL